MRQAIYSVAILVVLWGAHIRAAAVILGLARSLLQRKRFRTFRIGWVEGVTWVEPFLLAACTYVLYGSRDERFVWVPSAPNSTVTTACGVIGAILVLGGYAVLLWAFHSWPALFVGHAVLQDHELVSDGAYGVVRHPVYLAAFLVWLGLAVAFTSVATLAIFVFYVLPAYILYMRSEERMMLEAFGDSYQKYCRRVPMLIPRLR